MNEWSDEQGLGILKVLDPYGNEDGQRSHLAHADWKLSVSVV